jgi:hypothetical protein
MIQTVHQVAVFKHAFWVEYVFYILIHLWTLVEINQHSIEIFVRNLKYFSIRTQMINLGIDLPRAMDDHVLLELSDHQLLLVGGGAGAAADGAVYTFDFDQVDHFRIL